MELHAISRLILAIKVSASIAHPGAAQRMIATAAQVDQGIVDDMRWYRFYFILLVSILLAAATRWGINRVQGWWSGSSSKSSLAVQPKPKTHHTAQTKPVDVYRCYYTPDSTTLHIDPTCGGGKMIEPIEFTLPVSLTQQPKKDPVVKVHWCERCTGGGAGSKLVASKKTHCLVIRANRSHDHEE